MPERNSRLCFRLCCRKIPLTCLPWPLADMHGNTHFPIMVGAAKRFEDTGEGLYKTIVLNFIDGIVTKGCL